MDTKQKVVQELEKSTKRFVDFMNQYAGQSAVTESSNKWDMQEVIEHVILTDQRMYKAIQQPFHAHKNGHFTKYRIRDLALNRRKKLKSRQELEPGSHSDKSISELIDQFRKTRAGIIEGVSSGALDLESEEARPHPNFGLLTRRDWLYLMCFHSDRHVGQAQELLFCH